MIVGVILALMAQGLAFICIPAAFPLVERVRVVLIWALCCVILFGLREPLPILILVMAIAALLNPSAPAERVGFFLTAVPALPYYLSTPLPFPGLTQLFSLTPYKMFAVAILLPVLFSARADGRKSAPPTVWECLFVLYFLYTGFVVYLDSTPTNGIRWVVDQVLLLGLAYGVIRYAVRSVDDFDVCLRGFVMGATVLAAVAIVSALKNWDFYKDIYRPPLFALADTRGGYVRIEATINTHSLCYILGATLLLLEYLKTRVFISFVQLWVLRAMCVAGMFFTNARGGMLASAVAVSWYVLLSIRSLSMRRLLSAAYVAALVAGLYWTATQDTSKLDPYGTAAYRQELLVTSLKHLWDNPFFGDYNYIQSGKFDHLITGLKIIDVTNLYLQIALPYGLIGLVMYLGVFVSPLPSLMYRSAGGVERATRRGKPPRRVRPVVVSWLPLRVRWVSLVGIASFVPTAGHPDRIVEITAAQRLVASIVIGWLALVTTTSEVGLTTHVGLVFAALGRALLSAYPVAGPAVTASGAAAPNLRAARRAA